MKNNSIKKRFMIINIIVGIVMLLLSFGILSYNMMETEEKVYVNTQKQLHHKLAQSIEGKKNVGITNAISMANDGRIKNAIRTGDRKLGIMSLSTISSEMKAHTNFKNVKVHIHTKDNKSYIRGWKPKKYGDDLSGFRASVVEVNKTQKPVNTMELGKAGLSLRTVVPIKDDDGTHLGSLEFIQGLNSVAKSFNESKDAFLFLMDLDIKKVQLFDSSKKFKNYLISQKFVNGEFLNDARKINMQELFKNGSYIGEKYYYTFDYVKDFQDKKLGIYLVGRPLSIVNHVLKDSEALIYNSLILIFVLVIVLLIGTVINLQRVVINPLSKLSETVVALMKYDSADQEIEVKNNDEIGALAKHFNSYMAKLRENMKHDQIVVEEVDKAIQMVRAGFYAYTVEAETDNRSTNDLKNSVNSMIKDLAVKFDIINNALIEYGNAKFDHKFEVENVSGTVGSIVFATKSIGNNISELLATIMTSGEQLSSNINTLVNSANSLSTSANAQAASLEETAAAVEEISSNIQSSSENVSRMAKLSDEVMSSSSNGQKLASQTVAAMDEINNKVSDINEAILIIDQIAFQTNILSLNAAVEAATAGEAGKGFAVVAGEVRNLAARSAEAANEIKALVQSANEQTIDGKRIAGEMIEGYEILTHKIEENKNMIDIVSQATKEQTQGIIQINDSINILDKNTQENANDATNIDALAKEVQHLSTNLINVANKASYIKEAKEQICNMDMTYELNTLKLDHLKFKTDNFERLNERSSFKVATHHDCRLAKWIKEQELNETDITKTANWKELNESHAIVHEKVQEYIDRNADNDSNEHLLAVGNEIEKATERVFIALNVVKKEYCKSRNNI